MSGHPQWRRSINFPEVWCCKKKIIRCRYRIWLLHRTDAMIILDCKGMNMGGHYIHHSTRSQRVSIERLDIRSQKTVENPWTSFLCFVKTKRIFQHQMSINMIQICFLALLVRVENSLSQKVKYQHISKSYKLMGKKEPQVLVNILLRLEELIMKNLDLKFTDATPKNHL